MKNSILEALVDYFAPLIIIGLVTFLILSFVL